MDHHFGLLAGGLAGLDWPAEFNPLVWGFLAIVAIAVGYVLLRSAVRDGVYAALRMHDGARPRARDRGVARLGALLILSAAALLAATAARAGEPRSLEQRVAELEGHVGALTIRVAALEAARGPGSGPSAGAKSALECAAAESARRAIERAYAGRAGMQSVLVNQMPAEHAVELRAVEARYDSGAYGPVARASLLVLSMENAYLRCVLFAAQRRRLPAAAESALFALQRALGACAWPEVVSALEAMDAAMPKGAR